MKKRWGLAAAGLAALGYLGAGADSKGSSSNDNQPVAADSRNSAADSSVDPEPVDTRDDASKRRFDEIIEKAANAAKLELESDQRLEENNAIRGRLIASIKGAHLPNYDDSSPEVLLIKRDKVFLPTDQNQVDAAEDKVADDGRIYTVERDDDSDYREGELRNVEIFRGTRKLLSVADIELVTKTVTVRFEESMSGFPGSPRITGVSPDDVGTIARRANEIKEKYHILMGPTWAALAPTEGTEITPQQQATLDDLLARYYDEVDDMLRGFANEYDVIDD